MTTQGNDAHRVQLHPQAALEAVNAEKEFWKNRALLLQHQLWEVQQDGERLRAEFAAIRRELEALRAGGKIPARDEGEAAIHAAVRDET